MYSSMLSSRKKYLVQLISLFARTYLWYVPLHLSSLFMNMEYQGEVYIQPESQRLDLNFHRTITGENTGAHRGFDQIQSRSDSPNRDYHSFPFIWWIIHQINRGMIVLRPIFLSLHHCWWSLLQDQNINNGAVVIR
jgi:hypothetical protein